MLGKALSKLAPLLPAGTTPQACAGTQTYVLAANTLQCDATVPPLAYGSIPHNSRHGQAASVTTAPLHCSPDACAAYSSLESTALQHNAVTSSLRSGLGATAAGAAKLGMCGASSGGSAYSLTSYTSTRPSLPPVTSMGDWGMGCQACTPGSHTTV